MELPIKFPSLEDLATLFEKSAARSAARMVVSGGTCITGALGSGDKSAEMAA